MDHDGTIGIVGSRRKTLVATQQSLTVVAFLLDDSIFNCSAQPTEAQHRLVVDGIR